MSTTTPEFWDNLQELRKLSQRVLVALEADDLNEVAKLANRSDDLLSDIKPEIDRRCLLGDTELSEVLEGLRRMNDRIVEELDCKRAATAFEIEQTRSSRLQLNRYKSGNPREPELLDIRR
ncbi:MAG: hypothetical protein V3W41_03805 [Planctomycetota bacterium]